MSQESNVMSEAEEILAAWGIYRFGGSWRQGNIIADTAEEAAILFVPTPKRKPRNLCAGCGHGFGYHRYNEETACKVRTCSCECWVAPDLETPA